jgi:hypothetical protein
MVWESEGPSAGWSDPAGKFCCAADPCRAEKTITASNSEETRGFRMAGGKGERLPAILAGT